MHARTTTLALLSLLAAHTAHAQPAAPHAANPAAQWAPLLPAALAQGHAQAGSLTDVTITPQLPGLTLVTVPLDNGASLDVIVEPFTVRAQNFEVLLRGADGALTRYDAPAPKTVRGTVVGNPMSRVYGSLDGPRASLHIEQQGQETLILAPADLPGTPDTLHLLHPAAQAIPREGECAVRTPADQARPPQPRNPAPADAAPAGTPAPGELPGGSGGGGGGIFDDRTLGLYVTQISIDSDNEFFVNNGSNANNCIDFIDAAMVGVDAIYRAQVGISYSLNRIVLSTDASDPFTATAAGSRLAQLRDVWEGSPYSGFERDVVQGFMGIDFDGNTIGVAYICNNGGCSGQICTRRNHFTCPFGDGTGNDCGGYSVIQTDRPANSLDQINLGAHELGHNWGAQHCNGEGDCYIMCTNLNSCMGSQSIFGVSAVNAIVSHRNSRPCLHQSATSVYVNGTYSGAELGTLANPYITFRAGAFGCETGGNLFVTPGTYDGGHSLWFLARPMVIAPQGASAANPVRIGR